jgi:hypothetical protein
MRLNVKRHDARATSNGHGRLRHSAVLQHWHLGMATNKYKCRVFQFKSSQFPDIIRLNSKKSNAAVMIMSSFLS